MAYRRPTPKIEDAARLAAAFAYVALAAGEKAGLVLSRDGGDEWVAASSAASQLPRVVDTLRHAATVGPTVLDRTLARAAERSGRRALILILSDLMVEPDRLRRGLARLRHGRHDIAILRVRHGDESSFPFQGWVRFGGLEGPQAAVAYGPAARNTYLDHMAAHDRAVREACRATQADFVSHVVGRPLIDTVRAVIRRRQP